MLAEKIRSMEIENEELKERIIELEEMTGIKEPLPKDCEQIGRAHV